MLMPPKFGNPPLPWSRLPRWLRLLRVLLVAAWASSLTCLTTLFCLQAQVLASPKASMGIYSHPVSYKGDIFYLSEPLFNVWRALELADIPLIVATALLIFACNTFEYKIKRRLWDEELGDV